jgi:hypothetical protein
MKARQLDSSVGVRRGPLEDARVQKIDAARVRVLRSAAPSLAELTAKFGDWACPDMSGRVKKPA